MMRTLGLAVLGAVAALAAPVVADGDAEPPPSQHALWLGGGWFDPAGSDPVAPAALADPKSPWRSASVDGPDLRLVQWIGPIDPAWPESLRQHGVTPIQYLHPHTYIVWAKPTALDRFGRSKAAGSVRWVGDFHPAFRVLPTVRKRLAKASSSVPVRVIVYRGADVGEIAERLETLGVTVRGRRPIDRMLTALAVELPPTRLDQVAAIPGVYSVQPTPTDGGVRGELSAQIVAGGLDGGGRAVPGYATSLDVLGVDGSGVIAAVVDNGTATEHPDLIGRFIDCAGDTCGGPAALDHGTHVAGIFAGDAASGTTDSEGFIRGQGAAPGATLVEQVLFSFADAGGMLELMRESVANGAVISSNSWGPSGRPLGYDADTRQVDVGVRGVDTETSASEPLTYVVAIMNGDGGTSTQGTPDEAKNLIAVGSTWARGGALGNVSANSGHGPALDGRRLPHLVAPGCNVDSTLPSDRYGWLCGTSMAAPLVSGAAALFVERFRDLRGDDPSPALVKAAMLASASSLAGGLDADGGTLGHPPDNRQGWGRLELAPLLDPSKALWWDAPVRLDGTGERWTTEVEPVEPDAAVRILLVWTDAPGHGLGGATPAWNNDLDLIVDLDRGDPPTIEIHGNVFGADGWSTNGGSADGANNVEGVRLGPHQLTSTTRLRLIVDAANIPSDGVPGVGDGTDQDFALVCLGCRQPVLFADGFELGTDGAWAEVEPGSSATTPPSPRAR